VSTAPADLLRTAARGVGQLLLTAGYVLLLFVVYELWVTDLLSNARQDELTAELREEWAAPAAVPAELQGGEAFAMLHIPRLGADYARAVVEGTGTEDLEQGPGHYRGTAMPGDSWFVYRVLGPADVVPGQQVVSPSDVSVIAPTPNGPPDGAPTGAYLTLTTCHPEYSARERLIVHAVLEGGPVSRAEAPEGPPALRGV
jgi:sortase (surface protein transpeptidase)